MIKRPAVTLTDPLSMPRTAIDFHDQRAASWSETYRKSAHFKRRARDWENILCDTIVPRTRMLDLGCGSGDLSIVAARFGAALTCVDGSPAMLAEARVNVQRVAPDARFVEACVAALPLADGEFDVAIASSLLEYVDSLEAALVEIRRVVRTGGLLLVTVPNPHSIYRRLEGYALRLAGRPTYRRFVNPKIYRRNITVDLTNAGFKVIETRLTGIPPKVFGERFAAMAERHPLLATMTLFIARAI